MMRSRLARDPLALYEASVQGAEFDIDFFERVFRARNGRLPLTLREDFCGTASIACAWVARGAERRATGVDLDSRTLAWCRRHHFTHMGAAARRVRLARADVRRVRTAPVDVVCAMNFSYWVFHTRDTLRGYFRAARRALRPGGVLCVNVFGGTDAMGPLVERRRIAASQAADGGRLPGFTYVWDQVSFNPIDHRLRCDIHFRLADGTWLRRAFRYDWRMWTLPEIQELMGEAGFRDVEVHVEGWDDARHEPNGVYRRRTRFETQQAWLAFVVAGR